MKINKKTAGSICAAIAIAVGIISKNEGLALTTYKDSVGINTVCYGETHFNKSKYTLDECKNMLSDRVNKVTESILKCNPMMKDDTQFLIASIDMAYNVGTNAYCKSTLVKKYKDGNRDCSEFKKWKYANGKTLKGLELRANQRYNICYQD